MDSPKIKAKVDRVACPGDSAIRKPSSFFMPENELLAAAGRLKCVRPGSPESNSITAASDVPSRRFWKTFTLQIRF